MVAQVPIYIACRDRLSELRLLVDWLERAGHERIVLVDNDSQWPPLLEYLEATPHRVVRLSENIGPRAFWDAGIFDVDRSATEHYVLTDPDVLPVEECPMDLVDHLVRVLDTHPDVQKAGPGLKLDDLPAHYKYREAVYFGKTGCGNARWETGCSTPR